MNKIRDFFKRNFKLSYKLDKALEDYLRNYFENSDYFSLKKIDFVEEGFSMSLDYKVEKESQPIIQRKTFFDYVPEYYSRYLMLYQNLYATVERLMKNMDSALEKAFSIPDYYSGGLNVKWAM